MKGLERRQRATTPAMIGYCSVLLMLGAFGTWSIGTQISGAVLASGTVEVQSERQVIQHPDGGVVGEILARDGMRVQAGDVLLRLDGTFLWSELNIVENQLINIFASTARLEAERDGSKAPDFSQPPEFHLAYAETLSDLISTQRSLFYSRKSSLERAHQQIGDQKVQIELRITGMEAQHESMIRQRQFVIDELENLQSLFQRGLVQGARLSEFNREEARLEGEINNLSAMIAEARMRSSELNLEKSRLEDERREDALNRLTELSFRQLELQERRISLMERISRLDVRAPVSGVVFSSLVVAEQSVVRPADPLMYIVPDDQPFYVSARIDPIDIDQVYHGQDVSLMFTTFNRQTTPEIPGSVLRVSADAVTEESTGAKYYEAVVLPDEDVLDQNPGLRLMPGMPVESFLQTEKRTPMSYLIQPFTVYFHRAFRGE